MTIRCPLVDNKEISDIDCLENSDIADGMIKESALQMEFKVKKDWRDICKACKNHKE